MIRKEGDRNKRSKNFPTTFVGNNRQMLQEIRDSLSHLLKTQSTETSKTESSMQIKSELSGSQPPLSGDQRTSAAKSQSYRQKALAEIRNSLLPFANENGSSSAASTVSTISSTTTSGISSASGLSNASGNSSPCQSIEHNGLDKESSRAQHLHGLGYDEDPSNNNNRGLKVGSNRNNIDPATIEQFYKMQLDSQQNGLPKQVSGLSSIASKIIRKPSFESSGREINLNIHRRSPALDSSTASTRSDSPSITLSSVTSRSTVDSSSRAGTQISSTSQDSISHLQVSRQYSPNFNLEPPPPPPPRTQVPPPTPPRGTTPPPPVSQADLRLVHQSFLQSNQQVQHMLKRISPAPQTTRSTQGIAYSSQLSQSSTPQRGTSPVSIGRSPIVVQNSLQAQLNHQLQSAIYNGGVTQIEPPPPYPIGSSQAVGSSLSSKLTSPPPYTPASTNRQSPIQATSDYSSVSSHLPKRSSPTIYPQQLPLPTSTTLSASSSVATSAPVQSNSALKPAPLQAWSARQFPPIMLSVKSTQVQKPVLQTAVAPTAPPPANSPHPPPSYSIAVHQRTQPDNETNNYTSNSLSQANTLITSAPQYSTTHNMVVPNIPTTDPPSYASTMQALAAQRGVSSIAPTVVGSHTNYNLQFSSTGSTSTTSTPSSSSSTNPLANLTNPLESSPSSIPASHSSSNNVTDNVPVSQSAGTVIHNVGNNIVKNNHVDPSNINYNQIHAPLQRKFSPMSTEVTSHTEASRPSSPGSRTSDHSPVSFQPPTAISEAQPELSQERQTATPPLSNSNSQPSTPPSYKMTLQSPIPERKVQSKEKEEERRETKVRNYSPQAFKFYMEQHVENVLKSHQQRLHRRLQLETEMAKVGLSEEAQFQMRKMLHQKESNYIRLKRAKMDKAMFVKIKAIGVGAFGEVALVRKVDTNHLYAMKTLRKAYVLKRNQVAHVKAERDILAEADNEWVVKLYYSFQDSDNLYFVMDYIPGGDMMSLLIKYGIFQEPLARFYIAELVCAVESVHKMGFIHRDIKPDNILIDRDGHIKLTDFGLCTGFRWTHNSKYYQNGEHSRQDSMEPDENWTNECRCNSNSNLKPLERRRRREHQRCLAHSLVGTPNYIAPEVLMRTGYTQLCDWWSVGVILYEMLVGQPPFLANTPVETQYKVINWETTLKIPRQANLSPEATELILQLCTSHDRRLGKKGPSEVKAHPFFKSIDFEGGVRRQPAPYMPTIRYATDTSNFDPVDPDKLHNSDSSDAEEKGNSIYDNGKHPEHAFFEFTFRRFFDDGGHAYPTRLGLDDNDNQGPVYV